MQQIQMEAKLRTVTKKNAVGRLRRERNLIPGVMYGKGLGAVNLEVDPKQIHPGMTSALIRLRIAGEDGVPEEQTVMLRDVQRHPVTLQIQHVDFVRIAMDQELEVKIPVHIVGSAPGVKAGGVLEIVHHELDIRCLPSQLPGAITVDVSGLEINDAVMVKDLPVTEGVAVLVGPHEPVVHVVPPRVEEEPAAEAEAAEEKGKEPEVIGQKEREDRRASKDQED